MSKTVLMAVQDLESRVVGALPLLQRISRAIGLVEVIDQLVPWDETRCRISPGQRIEALVLNILAGRFPLYRVHEFYEDTATDILFGEGIGPEDLTDDCLGRALDKLAESNPTAVYSAVALRACMVEGIDRQFGHFDTTSISAYGEYPGTEPEDLQLVPGYSKDGHPELKQLILAMLCSRQGVPIWADSQNGNASDHIVNQDAIDAFCRALSPEQLQETVYVADAALVTGPNLARMAKLELRFLSRLPESFSAAGEAKSAACIGGLWQDLGQLAAEKRPTSARYRASEHTAHIDGRPYRLLVVYSDHLDQRKRKTFAKHLAKERADLEKDLAKLQKARFSCAADAEIAAGEFLMNHAKALHPISLDVVSLTQRLPYHRRGRPSQDLPLRTAQEFALSGQIGEPDPARIEEIHRLRACFVLITNLSPEAFPAQRLLEEYRNQVAVEQRFRFVKDPMFIDALYLHTPRRIDALAYVFVMACLVYSVFERRVRAALQSSGEQILLPGKRLSSQPTAKMLLLLLAGLCIGRIGNGPWMIASPRHMTERASRVVRFAGFDFESTYTGPPP